MTREEAIARIKDHMIVHKMHEPRAIYISEALDMAIQALSQEPCDDAISREAFIKRYDEWMYSEYGKHCEKDALAIRVANSLPPVTQKSGKWLKSLDYIGDVKCSICSKEYDQDVLYDAKYCPNCGARMESEE